MRRDDLKLPWSRTDWFCLAGVALWAAALRGLLVLTAGGHAYFQIPVMDMAYHDLWARRIVGGDFWGSEAFFRAPLYPYFLALLYKLAHGSTFGARLLQAGVGGGSAALCYLVGREFFDRRVGVVAAAALATLWTAVYFDIELLLVVLEIPLGLAFIYGVGRALRRGSVGWAAAAGAALGLGAITRPNVLVVGAVIWLAFVAVRRLKRISAKRIIVALAVLYGVAGAFVAATGVRNCVVAREPVLISWQGGVNLWIGNNPEADGMTAIAPGTYGDWWRGYYETIRRAEEAQGRPLARAEVDRYYLRRAAGFFWNTPGKALKLLGRKAYIYTNAYEVANNFDLYYLKNEFPVLRFDPVSLYVILPLAFFGVGAYLREWRRLAPLYLFVAAYSATVILFFVNARFRMPVVPYLCIFAAAAFFYLWDRLRSWSRRQTLWRLGVLAALILYCAADPFDFANRRGYEAQGHYTMGSIYLARGDLEAAEAEYLEALEISGSIVAADALNDLGIVAAQRGDYDRAEHYFRRAVEHQPDYAKGWNNLGNVAAERGDAATARRYYEHALAVDPEDSRARYFLGKLLLAEGDAAGARENFEGAVYYQPNFAAAWYELGGLARADGDSEAAARYYAETLRFLPESAEARFALAGALHRQGDYVGAAREYRTLLAQGEDARARYNLACALARQGRAEEATAELRRAIALAPERYREMAATDDDLASLRGRPDFEKLVRP